LLVVIHSPQTDLDAVTHLQTSQAETGEVRAVAEREAREELNGTLQEMLAAEVGDTAAKKALENLVQQLLTVHPPVAVHEPRDEGQSSPPPTARTRQTDWANSTMRVPAPNSSGLQYSYCDPPPPVPAGEQLEMVVVDRPRRHE
jgi:hypothetical protein